GPLGRAAERAEGPGHEGEHRSLDADEGPREDARLHPLPQFANQHRREPAGKIIPAPHPGRPGRRRTMDGDQRGLLERSRRDAPHQPATGSEFAEPRPSHRGEHHA
ncbi:MAG: hypothetical protein ACK56I_08030, partial [bacterium]